MHRQDVYDSLGPANASKAYDKHPSTYHAYAAQLSYQPTQPSRPTRTQQEQSKQSKNMSNTQAGHAQERVTKGSSASEPRKVKFNVGE
jgi:hypothetical protein